MNKNYYVKNINYYARILIMSLILLTGAWVLFSGVEWYWILIAGAYTIILNDVFCHRICAHRMFKIKVDSKLYKILVFLASIDMGYGPVKDVVIAHGLHHIHSDKGPEDNMNWRYHWYSTTIVSPIPRLNDVKPKNYEEYLQKQTHKHHNIWSDPWTDFCSRHHVKISFLTCLVLAVLCPVILLKVICLGRFLLTVMTGIAGSVGHMDFFPGSYRNFKTNDTSSNSIVFHYLFLGLYTGMLQNNHHANPASIKPNPRWWEIDTSYPFVLALKHFIEKK